MAALWIAHVTVTDEKTYANYAAIATEAITAHGGVFLARGGKYLQREGRDHARNVVTRFPSLKAAQACYHSPKYQQALEFAKKSSERSVVLVEEI